LAVRDGSQLCPGAGRRFEQLTTSSNPYIGGVWFEHLCAREPAVHLGLKVFRARGIQSSRHA
jgi:hypothetical protein